MKITLIGDNAAAVELFDVLQQTGDMTQVVCPIGRGQDGGCVSIFDYARERSAEALLAPESQDHPIVLQDIQRFAPDLIVCAGYFKLADDILVSLPSVDVIGIGPTMSARNLESDALLPSIQQGEIEVAITLGRLPEGGGSSCVLIERSLSIGCDETGFELQQRAARAAAHLFQEFRTNLREYLKRPSRHGQASSHPLPKAKLTHQIDWTLPAAVVHNTIRALAAPLAGAFTFFQGRRCVVLRAGRIPNDTPCPESRRSPGDVYEWPEDGTIRVRCGDGDLTLSRVSLEGVELAPHRLLSLGPERQSTCKFQFMEVLPPKLAIAGGTPALDEFLYFGRPLFGREEEEGVLDCLRTGWVGTGPKVMQFEREFGVYCENPNAVAVSSCTAALHLSLVILGIQPGDEVITTPLTFAATVNVIEHVGGVPVFADVDPTTWNLDPDDVERKISDKTTAIIAVHFGGLACDMNRLQEVARQHSVPIIEDAAHAVGGRTLGKPIGQSSNLTCFSFYANKNLTSIEGGMLCCPNEEVAQQVRCLRMHGMRQDAWARFRTRELILARVLVPGFKYNLTDLQAAIGMAQLRKLDRMQAKREELALLYDEALRSVPGIARQPRFNDDPDSRHALHLYAIALDRSAHGASRNEIVAALRAENVGVGIHYEAIHLHPHYREKYGHRRGLLPVAERISDSIMSLPLSPAMNGDEVEQVSGAVRKVLDHYYRPR